MDEAEKKKRVRAFTAKWLAAEGRENGETHDFWREFLHDVLDAGRDFPVVFEKPVKVDNASRRIDVFLPMSRTLVEQKSKGIDLSKKEGQSGGAMFTPFEQGRNYSQWLPFDERPRWIVACNFSEFWIYDMNQLTAEPTKISLEELPKKLHLFNFLTAGTEEHIDPLPPEVDISVKAGEIVARIYESLLKSARNPDSPETLRSLNIFCVRLVFCLYAENAELFGPKQSEFRDYIKAEGDARYTRRALMNLFKILNTPEDKRDPYLREENPRLAAFPYANGGLFADVDAEVPMIDEATRHAIIDDASAGIDWSNISPTIFGAVFESTLNPETRRKGGMHYTSPLNIHKVIDPLFLDDLVAELDSIEQARVSANARTKMLLDFQEKLASLKFLDPACGSGNFLTETFLSLRRLENRAIKLRLKDQMVLSAIENPVRVSISQFYGIEINDFAAVVAKTAMWIAENQMLAETKEIIGREIEFLPLKSYANVAEGNALKMDWSRLEVESGDLWHASQQAQEHTPREAISYDYIFGNPPFVGSSYQTDEQKADMEKLWCDEKGKPYNSIGKLDYVTCWFFKAASFIKDTHTHVAFVATNSISQGEQVALLWKPLFERFGIHIDFAHRTFIWNSESNDKAQVHCVVVGFSSAPNSKPRIIFDGDTQTTASNINGYLLDAPNVFVESRRKPLCKVPEINKGSQPTDDGNLIIEADEYDEFLKKEPGATKFVKRFMGSVEFINGKPRWCLWLVDASPSELRAMPEVMKRVEAVREFRLASKKKQTRKDAATPTLFQEIRQPTSDYVAIPEVSSGGRYYVPVDFLTTDIVCSNKMQLIPEATLFHFGVLTSDVHMAWMRVVCGRFKSDYDYSGIVVYNNFPWASADEEQIQKISDTAQGILDARAKFPDSTLADLYDELAMPKELRDAHAANDRAVRKLFGFSAAATEAEIVRELFERYSALASSAREH